MKTVSYDLELKLTEAARKHGVVLPNASSCWMCDDLGRWYMHIGVHWKNNFDFTSLPAHTADELMDWFMVHMITIQIVIMNDKYAVIFQGNLSDPIAYAKNKNIFDKNLADALAQMAIWLIENGYLNGVGNE